MKSAIRKEADAAANEKFNELKARMIRDGSDPVTVEMARDLCVDFFLFGACWGGEKGVNMLGSLITKDVNDIFGGGTNE